MKADFLASLVEVPKQTVDLLCAGAELIGESADRLAYGGVKPNNTLDPIGLLGRIACLCLLVGLSMFVGGLIGLFSGGIRGMLVGIADGFWESAFPDASVSPWSWDNPFL